MFTEIIEKFFNDLIEVSSEKIDSSQPFPILRLLFIRHKIDNMISKYFTPSSVLQDYYEHALIVHQGIFTCLDKHNIPYVVVKGIVNAQYYDNELMRNTRDIDILIDLSYCQQVENLMDELGYFQAHVRYNRIMAYNREEKLFYMTQTHQMAPFISKNATYDSVLYFDFNFGFGKKYINRIAMSDFISDRISFNYKGVDLYRLTPEKNFLFSIMHCYRDISDTFQLRKHGGYRIKNFLDIYLMFCKEKDTFDYRLIRQLISRLNINREVLTVLYMVSILFDDESILLLTDCESDDQADIINRISVDSLEKWNIAFSKRFNRSEMIKYFRNNDTSKEMNIYKTNKRFL